MNGVPVSERSVLGIVSDPPRFESGDARVIDQDVESALQTDDSLPIGLDSNVEFFEPDAEPVSGPLSVFRVEVRKDDIGALGAKRRCDRLTDPASAACHERRFVLQPCHR
jgi:hypothetical protein